MNTPTPYRLSSMHEDRLDEVRDRLNQTGNEDLGKMADVIDDAIECQEYEPLHIALEEAHRLSTCDQLRCKIHNLDADIRRAAVEHQIQELLKLRLTRLA